MDWISNPVTNNAVGPWYTVGTMVATEIPVRGTDDPPKWVRRNGKAMFISTMADEHLEATIKMLERGYDAYGKAVPEDRYASLPFLKEEAAKREMRIEEEGWDK